MSWPSPRSQAYKLSHDGAALSTHTQPAGTKGHHPLPPEGQPGKQWSFLSGSRCHRGDGPSWAASPAVITSHFGAPCWQRGTCLASLFLPLVDILLTLFLGPFLNIATQGLI